MLKFLLALLPLISIMFMIFVLKKSSIFTGIVACFLTAAIALSPFFHSSIFDLTEPIIKSSLTTSVIAYILFFGIFLFHLMDKAGAIDGIASSITKATDDKIFQILILALGLSPLIESVSGFGLAVIVIAPLLIALGFSPMKSSLIALISLCIIPWGTLAMGTIIGATLGNVDLDKMGMGSALMCIPIYLYYALLVVYIGVGFSALKKRLVTVLFIGFLLGASVWVCNRFVSVELAGLFGSLTVISVIFLMIKKRNITHGTSSQEKESNTIKNITPYLLLIVLLFISRIIIPIKNYLSGTFLLTIEKYNFELSILYSPGFFLCIVCIFTIFFFRLPVSEISESIIATFKKCYPVIITTFLYVVVSEIMSEAKMIQLLSLLAAQSFGQFYVFVSPLIGAIGGFLTGSNTASNSMFIRLQTETALHIGMSPILVACSQNVSSSLMTMVNPSRVALSCSVCKISTNENEIQKSILFVGLGTLTIILIELFLFFIFR
ncbi:L-lactate permease [Lysinibacillus fusiformis]|uniref:L-lactate permease n=1 Tax=Lysinibacillus fusiformis TaxID=28031 RepID=UPI0004699460|nr:L-lactate permease [Lysinibacillus fusiformis]